MTDRPRLTTNHYAGTFDPPAHRRAILAAFAALPDGHSMTRRDAQHDAYGTTAAGAGSAASAVGWLVSHRLIERRPGDRYRITVAGRRALDLDRVLDNPLLDVTVDEVDDFPLCAQEA